MITFDMKLMKLVVLFFDFTYRLEVSRNSNMSVKMIFYYNIAMFDFNRVNIVCFGYMRGHIIHNIHWTVL